MRLEVASRPGPAGLSEGFALANSRTLRGSGRCCAASVLQARLIAALPIAVLCAALLRLAMGAAVLAGEPGVRPGGRNTPAILVAPGPGGVAIWCEDPQALEHFAELFAALAAIRSNGKEETVVFYLRHAKAASVAEILDAVFSGGSLAEEPQAAGPSFGGFGTPGSPMAGFSPAGPFAARMGSAFPFGGYREGSGALDRGAPQRDGGRTPFLSGRDTAFRRLGTSAQAASGVRITADSRLNALIVQAKPSDMDIIEELLKVLDQRGTPEEVAAKPRPRLIPVRHVPVQSLLGVLRQVYQDRLTNGGTNAGSGPRVGPDQAAGGQGPGGPGLPGIPQGPGGPGAGPAQFFQQLAMAAGAGRRGRTGPGAEESPKMALGADTRSNSLVVVAPDRLFEEVRELVQQLDRPATDNAEAIHVLALRSSNSELVRRALPAFMGDRVRVGQASAPPTSNGRRMEGTVPGGWRQRRPDWGERPAEPQGSEPSSSASAGLQSAPGPPPATFSGSPSQPPDGGAGGGRFGRGTSRGSPSPGVPPFPSGPVPVGGPVGPPLDREGLPPQPAGQFPLPSSPSPGPGGPSPPGGPEPGPSPPPPGTLP